jgi:hypothetical protein
MIHFFYLKLFDFISRTDRHRERERDKHTHRQRDRHTHRQASPPNYIHRVKNVIPSFDTFHIITFTLLTPFVKDYGLSIKVINIACPLPCKVNCCPFLYFEVIKEDSKTTPSSTTISDSKTIKKTYTIIPRRMSWPQAYEVSRTKPVCCCVLLSLLPVR